MTNEGKKQRQKRLLVYIQLLLYKQTIESYRKHKRESLFKTSHAALILNRLMFLFMYPFMFVLRKLPYVWQGSRKCGSTGAALLGNGRPNWGNDAN